MAWTDLSGANVPSNASGTDQGFDASLVKDFDRLNTFVLYDFGEPHFNGIFNPIYGQQVIDESGGSGGPTRPTSGLVYPRLV